MNHANANSSGWNLVRITSTGRSGIQKKVEIQMIDHIQRGNGRIRRMLRQAALCVILAALFIGFTALLMDAIVRESDWRAERMCRIYEICEPAVNGGR
jgi:hypothetical protein